MRIEIRNLQQSQLARDAVEAFFTGGQLDLDPGDMDLTSIDTLVAYASRHLHRDNEQTFDRTCPAQMQLQAEPARILDAASPTFLIELLGLIGDLLSSDNARPDGLGHVYANVRGANAIQLMYLAVLAWRTTGEQQYLDFLEQEILGRWRGLDLADTVSALRTPTWCRSWYGDHNLPEGTSLVCPTEDEKAFCEAGFEVAGIRLEGEPITHACAADAGECTFTDGCAWAMASAPLPPRLRHFTDFLWQRNRYKFGNGPAIEGQGQSPGLDLSEAFWLARIDGLITAGQGQVLAWRDEGACN